MYTLRVSRQLARRLPRYNTRLQPQALRQFQTSTYRSATKENLQDKDSLDPQSSEYSKTGSDQDSATVEDAAFSTDKPRPEQQRKQAGNESGSNVTNPVSHPIH